MIYTHERLEAKRPAGVGLISEPAPQPLLIEKDPTPWQRMSEYLEGRGLSFTTARYNGCYPILRNGLRLYIPARTRIDGHVYWQARSMDGNVLRYNSPFGPRRDALVVMRSVKRVLRYYEKVAIVEGPLDALAVAEHVDCMGIGLMGVTPSDEVLGHVLHLLTVYQPQVTLLVADRDSVGEMAKIQGWLAMKGYLSQMRIPQGFKDLCEGTSQQREELLT